MTHKSDKIITTDEAFLTFKGTRLAVFAGSFDPCHLGHLKAATEALENGLADHVFFKTFLVQPEGNKNYAPISHRLRMLEILIQESKWADRLWILDPIYLSNYFKAEVHAKLSSIDLNNEFLILAGNDTYYEGYPEFLRSTKHLVYMRPGFSKDVHRSILTGNYIERPAPTEISSSKIKKQSAGGSEELIPQSILSYMKEHSLYPRNAEV